MAIRLKRSIEPSWIDLGRDAALFCAPATTPLVHAARAGAQALLVELIGAGEAVTRAGGRIEGLPNLDDPHQLRGCLDSLFIVGLAELSASGWRGILDADDKPLDFDPALLARLLGDHDVAEHFLSQYLHPLNDVVAEGNG